MHSQHQSENLRLISVDAVRGLAIMGVVVFHLVWDLDYAGLIPPGLADHPTWLIFGRLLAGTFMILVGVNLVLAHKRYIRWRPYFLRLSVIAMAASIISVATYFAFPNTYIFFGILHAIATATLIGGILLHTPAIFTLLLGSSMIGAAYYFHASLFNTRWMAWIGFASEPPVSNDFVPVFPWVGLTLIGIAFTKIAVFHSLDQLLAAHEPDGAFARKLAWLGRHSLLIYLAHQPILLTLVLSFADGVR